MTLGAAAFVFALLVAQWLLCMAGVFHCRFGTDVTLQEAFVPVALFGLALFVLGLFVAVACQLYLRSLVTSHRWPLWVGYFLIAVVVGVLPLLGWDISTRVASPDPVLGNVNVLYLPLIAGSLGCAVVVLRGFLISARGPNPAVNLAPFGRWTLRDKAAQRRLP